MLTACKPSGFGVSATAARKDQDAGIGPKLGVQIGLENVFCNGMGEVADLIFRLLFNPVLIHI